MAFGSRVPPRNTPSATLPLNSRPSSAKRPHRSSSPRTLHRPSSASSVDSAQSCLSIRSLDSHLAPSRSHLYDGASTLGELDEPLLDATTDEPVDGAFALTSIPESVNFKNRVVASQPAHPHTSTPEDHHTQSEEESKARGKRASLETALKASRSTPELVSSTR